MTSSDWVTSALFGATLLLTFFAAWLGRKHASGLSGQGLGEHILNKWMVGLSAGATANSGFVVTGAVGLGYVSGPQWLFLPLAWLLGDAVFWALFPHRLNKLGRLSKSSSLSEFILPSRNSKLAKIIALLVGMLILFLLGGYTSAQWLAGQKFVSGAFNLPPIFALLIFALLIISYSAIGGFRGSIYADAMQALVRIIGTLIAITAISLHALDMGPAFWDNIALTDAGFKEMVPGNSLPAFIGFLLGYAAAALGFGLGQPQIVSRYLAGSSPEETKAAWWIYMGFVQFTWISMTLFGVLLRGVMPNIEDPESGLSVYFNQYFGSILTGIIVADIFASIAATSNSLLVSMAQSLRYDLFNALNLNTLRLNNSKIILIIGALTMLASLFYSHSQSVFELALSSVSLLGSALAPPVIIKTLRWKTSELSLMISILGGLFSALIWIYLGYNSAINEAFIGLSIGLLSHFFMMKKDVNSLQKEAVK